MNHQNSIPAVELSLTQGGASTRILERLIGIHLSDRRGCLGLALILALVTWVPLAVLSVLRGVALPGTVDQPFFHDITPQVRFLLALPLLIIADLIVGPFIARIGRQFVVSGLVPDGSLADFDEIAKSSTRFRESKLAELGVLAIAYATAAFNIHRELGTGVSSWLVVGGLTARNFTLAGWWYVLLSVPIYQFFLFRWVMRLCNWAVFLFRVARLDLQIIPTHPDRAAGLGFVGEALTPISIIMLAASSVLCSSIGTQVIYRDAKLQEFAFAFGFFVLVAIIAFLTPFAVFVPKLAATKRNGLMTYGALATRYTQLFDQKWVASEGLAEQELLGTADIQSLADIGNSFDRIENMKRFPVELRDLRALLVAAVLPAIPLALTQVSLKDVVQILTKVLF
jgi:hypothetical protein